MIFEMQFYLFKQAFPHMGGLQDTILAETLSFEVSRSGFVQVNAPLHIIIGINPIILALFSPRTLLGTECGQKSLDHSIPQCIMQIG